MTAVSVLLAMLAIAVVVGLVLGYLASAARAARRRAMAAIRAIREDRDRLCALPGRLRSDLETAANSWKTDRLVARLREIPIEELKQSGVGSVRWSALRSAGFQTLADLHGITNVRLQSLPGVGPTTASRVTQATADLVRFLYAQPAPFPSPELSEPHALRLVQQATACLEAQRLDMTPVTRALAAMTPRFEATRASTSFFAWLSTVFNGRASEATAQAEALATEAEALRGSQQFQGLLRSASAIENAALSLTAADVALRYQRQRDDYKTLLEHLLGGPQTGSDPVAAKTPQRSVVAPATPPVHTTTEPIAVPSRGPAARGFSIPASAGVRSGSLSISLTISGPLATPRLPDDARWHGPGEAAHVAGFAIPGGLLYVGHRLAAVAPYRRTDPALVDPSLPIDRQRIDWAGEAMPYWPSYSDVAPECRAAYLHWLAHGREHPGIGIGYVFLFFYGLERRLFHDGAAGSLPTIEREIILREIERLLALYGTQRSFRRYASELLTVCRLQTGAAGLPNDRPPTVDPSGEMPLSMRVALGEIVRAARPLPADWALAWVSSHPETRWRTPAQRCRSELESLFSVRYRQRFGEGMRIKPNRSRLTGNYRPASASFGGAIDVPLRDLPDVAVLSAPVRILRDLAYSCVDDLESYSRLIGRDPAARDSLAGLAVLPLELATAATTPVARRLLELVRQRLDDASMATVPVSSLLEHIAGDAEWNRPTALAVAQWLQKAGYGIEPDVRFGSRPPKELDELIVFRLPQASPCTPTPAYDAAVTLLDMAVLVAQADGIVDVNEEARLIGRLEQAMHLDDAERARLGAHLYRRLASGASSAEVKKRAARLDPAQRESVAVFLLSVAAADGRLDPSEVDVLARLYDLLGLALDRLYADLHALGSAEDSIRSPRAPQAFTLDRARVEERIAESAAVSTLLQEIFTGDDLQAPAPLPEPVGSAVIAGFDSAHSGLLRELASRQSWSRAELEASAARFGLLPEGALDVLNERAYDLYGEPLVEGDDPLLLNRQALEELMT